MTKDQKLKQSYQQNAILESACGELAQQNRELHMDLDERTAQVNYAGELLNRATEQLSRSTIRIQDQNQKMSELDRLNENLERTRQITGQGMILERDELRLRADRLDMRIRGLGFEV